MPEQYNIKLIPKKNERKRWLNLWCFDIITEWILSEHDFEIKSKYHSFNQSFVLLLTHILSFKDDIILQSTFLSCRLVKVFMPKQRSFIF